MALVSNKKNRKFHIKSGDTVYVTAGKAKGRTGKVLRVITDSNKAVVEKLNMVKKHNKPTQKNPAGGIVDKEQAIDISNLALYDTKTSSRVKVGYKVLDDGRKVRVNRKTGEEI